MFLCERLTTYKPFELRLKLSLIVCFPIIFCGRLLVLKKKRIVQVWEKREYLEQENLKPILEKFQFILRIMGDQKCFCCLEKYCLFSLHFNIRPGMAKLQVNVVSFYPDIYSVLEMLMKCYLICKENLQKRRISLALEDHKNSFFFTYKKERDSQLFHGHQTS